MKFRHFLIPALLGIILLALALAVRSGKFAREDPGEPISPGAREASDGPRLPADDARQIANQYGSAEELPSGLRYIVVRPGEGSPPEPGDEVVAHYRGTLLDGQPFDSSYDRGQPFRFRVGQGQVIAGWDEAFSVMPPGEKRILIIPYWLAYGERGIPPTIPPRATLVFEVERLNP